MSNTLLPMELDTAMSPMPARTRGHLSEGGDPRGMQGPHEGLFQAFGLTAGGQLAELHAYVFASLPTHHYRMIPMVKYIVNTREYVLSIEYNKIHIL